MNKEDTISLLRNSLKEVFPPSFTECLINLIELVASEQGGGTSQGLQSVTDISNITDRPLVITGIDLDQYVTLTDAVFIARYPGIGMFIQSMGPTPGSIDGCYFIASSMNMQLSGVFNLSAKLKISHSGGDTSYPLEIIDFNPDDNLSAVFNGNIQVPTATQAGHAIPLGQGATLTGLEILENKTIKEPIINGLTINVIGGGDTVGDMYYRGSDGKLINISGGQEGQTLKWISGTPTWTT